MESGQLQLMKAFLEGIMQELLDSLMADFLERPIPALTRRRARLPWLR